jgi:hypothetical protein
MGLAVDEFGVVEQQVRKSNVHASVRRLKRTYYTAQQRDVPALRVLAPRL